MELRWLVKEEEYQVNELVKGRGFMYPLYKVVTKTRKVKVLQYWDDDVWVWRDVPEVDEREQYE
jgi:hypothetical protein